MIRSLKPCPQSETYHGYLPWGPSSCPIPTPTSTPSFPIFSYLPIFPRCWTFSHPSPRLLLQTSLSSCLFVFIAPLDHAQHAPSFIFHYNMVHQDDWLNKNFLFEEFSWYLCLFSSLILNFFKLFFKNWHITLHKFRYITCWFYKFIYCKMIIITLANTSITSPNYQFFHVLKTFKISIAFKRTSPPPTPPIF